MLKHKRLLPMQLAKAVESFNERFPVGTNVVLRMDGGEILTTVVEPAMVLSGHSAVAWFAGVSGAYSIENDRVRRFA